MSRLDSFIRRIEAQRSILNDLASRLGAVDGPIFEFGLGSGRTYDHMRELFPDRRIIVFERVEGTSPISRPDPEDLVFGNIRETAARFADGSAAMIHADIESGVPESDREIAVWLSALCARLLKPGGYVASGNALTHPHLIPAPLPAGVAEGRYHVLRRA